jgi:hypothetical protein
MVGPKNTLLYRLRFFIIGAFVFCCLLTIPLMLSLIFTGSTAQAVSNDSANDSNASNLDDSPNIITSGVFETSDNLGRVTNSATQKIATGSKNFTKSVVDASAQSGKFMVHGIGNGVAFMAHGAIGSQCTKYYSYQSLSACRRGKPCTTAGHKFNSHLAHPRLNNYRIWRISYALPTNSYRYRYQ